MYAVLIMASILAVVMLSLFVTVLLSSSHCSQLLEKNMQLLIESVENLQQETYRLLGYEKNLAKQSQARQQFLQRRVSS